MKIEVKHAEPAHILHVAEHLRDADRIELSLSQPDAAPAHVVMESALSSLWCMAVTVDDVPVILFGLCAADHPRMGVPWMVGTDSALSIQRPFIKGCRHWVATMQETFPFLYNHVHAGNTVSINWLRWLGFHVDDSPSEPGGQFHYFWKGSPNV